MMIIQQLVLISVQVFDCTLNGIRSNRHLVISAPIYIVKSAPVVVNSAPVIKII